MNKNQVKGALTKPAGKVQQAADKAIGSTDQQHGIKKHIEGRAEKVVGDVKQGSKELQGMAKK